MRKISSGAGVPEGRFTPQPFYFTDASPTIFRWNELNWDPDARQRWFYEHFTGRTHGSVWRSECYRQDDNTGYAKSIQGGYFSDPLAWTMPGIGQAAAILFDNEPIPFCNYINLGQSTRPANLYCNRAADALATVDNVYIAPRNTFARCAMRMHMRLPSAAEIAARGSTGGGDTLLAVGFEVNSQGAHAAYYLHLIDTGAALQYELVVTGYGADGTTHNISVAPLTINKPGEWAYYYFEYDPPVFRFVQPTAAGDYNAFAYPSVTELTTPSLAATPVVQPFICNESEVSTAAGNVLTWYVGQWAIFPTARIGNVYQINKRTNPNATCSPYYAIFDSGGRPYLHINVKTLGCGCAYTIEHTEDGKDQPATAVSGTSEVRTWRRIDDSDYTGVTAIPSGEAGIGLFNAARFLRVTLSGCNACGTEEIVFTANAGGER